MCPGREGREAGGGGGGGASLSNEMEAELACTLYASARPHPHPSASVMWYLPSGRLSRFCVLGTGLEDALVLAVAVLQHEQQLLQFTACTD